VRAAPRPLKDRLACAVNVVAVRGACHWRNVYDKCQGILVRWRPSSAHNDGMTAQKSIVRMWRGVVRSDDADEYIAYIERTGMKEYRETPGNLDAWMLARDLGDGRTEILTVSRWQSFEAIEGFAGTDIDTAVYYPEDELFLVERDDKVRHWTQVA